MPAYRYKDQDGTVHVFPSFAVLVAFTEARYSAREGRPIAFEGLDELQRDCAHADSLTLSDEPVGDGLFREKVEPS